MNIIHIGLERTGNTTVQNAIYSRQGSFSYIGASNDAYPNKIIEELIVRVSSQDSLDYDAHHAKSLLSEMRAEDSVHRPVIIASERFSLEGGADRRLVAERLHALFAPAKVLLVLRSQMTMVQAQYFSYLRGLRGRVATFEKWLDRTYGAIEFSIAPFRLGLDYEPLVQLYEDVFGFENLVLLPSELMHEDNSIYQCGLAELLRMPVEAVSKALRQNIADQRVSRRLLLAHRLQDMLPTNAHLPALGRQILPLSLYNPVRRFFVNGPRLSVPAIPELWCRRIAEVCAEGNARIERRRGLPLKVLGYPVAS